MGEWIGRLSNQSQASRVDPSKKQQKHSPEEGLHTDRFRAWLDQQIIFALVIIMQDVQTVKDRQ